MHSAVSLYLFPSHSLSGSQNLRLSHSISHTYTTLSLSCTQQSLSLSLSFSLLSSISQTLTKRCLLLPHSDTNTMLTHFVFLGRWYPYFLFISVSLFLISHNEGSKNFPKSLSPPFSYSSSLCLSVFLSLSLSFCFLFRVQCPLLCQTHDNRSRKKPIKN